MSVCKTMDNHVSGMLRIDTYRCGRNFCNLLNFCTLNFTKMFTVLQCVSRKDNLNYDFGSIVYRVHDLVNGNRILFSIMVAKLFT